MWKRAVAADMLHVPYKGAGPVMIDLVGGQVDLHFASLPAALPLIEGGKLRALATTSAERLPSLPNVPTLIEAGYPGFDYYVFYGVLVPAGTPDAIVGKLNTEIDRAIASPDMRKSLAERGVDVRPGTAKQFEAFLAKERAKWSVAVKEFRARRRLVFAHALLRTKGDASHAEGARGTPSQRLWDAQSNAPTRSLLEKRPVP